MKRSGAGRERERERERERVRERGEREKEGIRAYRNSSDKSAPRKENKLSPP
jgi:hypothetical protein